MAAAKVPPKLPQLSMYIVFNAFEKIPPPPDFPTFVEGFRHTGQYVRKNKCFLVTQLHRNIDTEGKYKFVNHASFDGPDFEAFKGPSPEFMAAVLKGQGPIGHQTFYPGGYAELGTSTSKPLAPWLQRDDNSLWILTTFNVEKSKTAELAEFEKNWQGNSGADFILNNAPKELGISKVGFYKKFTPRPALDYVLRAEITGVTGGSTLPAEEFLKTLKEFKYPDCVTATDCALYKTDTENTMFPEAGKKPLPDGHSWIPE